MSDSFDASQANEFGDGGNTADIFTPPTDPNIVKLDKVVVNETPWTTTNWEPPSTENTDLFYQTGGQNPFNANATTGVTFGGRNTGLANTGIYKGDPNDPVFAALKRAEDAAWASGKVLTPEERNKVIDVAAQGQLRLRLLLVLLIFLRKLTLAGNLEFL